jgi:hypothetical protein
METHARTPETASIPELLRELRDESTTLFRQEIALARTEVKEKISRLSRNAIYLMIGGVVAFTGLLFILLAVARVISFAFEQGGTDPAAAAWIGPAIVGVIVSIAGIVLLMKAKKTLSQESLVPEKTLQSLKEDTSWTRAKVQEA